MHGDQNDAASWPLDLDLHHYELFGGCGRLKLGGHFSFCLQKLWVGEQETWAPPSGTCLYTTPFKFYHSAELGKSPKTTSPLCVSWMASKSRNARNGGRLCLKPTT